MMPDPAQLRARQAGYDLLARLYLGEPDAPVLAYVRDLPGFAATVPAAAATPAGLAALAAEYQRVFGLNVYPYESIFRDSDLLLNTATTARVVRLYTACGFDWTPAHAGAPDHLGLELRLMRDLVAAERAAWTQGAPAVARRAQAQQVACLADHLAHWAPLCAQAVARVAALPFYRVLAELTVELVLTDLARADEGSGIRDQRSENITDNPKSKIQNPKSPTPNPQPPTPDSHSLSAVVRRLLTPADVGFFLTRADLRGLGQSLDLPVAFGDRFQMLQGLLATAGQYEQVPALLAGLAGLWVTAESEIRQWATDYPAWAGHGAPWLARVQTGQRLLQELQAQAGTLSD